MALDLTPFGKAGIGGRKYWYVATPYSKYEGGIATAFDHAVLATAALSKNGLSVYSPIVHCHSLCLPGGLDPLDGKMWGALCRPLLVLAAGVVVIRMPGWLASTGVQEEIKFAKSNQMPVVYLDPGKLSIDVPCGEDVPPEPPTASDAEAAAVAEQEARGAALREADAKMRAERKAAAPKKKAAPKPLPRT